MAGSFNLTGLSASEPMGQRQFGPQTIQGTVIIGETIETPLASGDNTFAIPVGSVACWITTPTNGTSALTVRTSANQSDAGLPINGAGFPMILCFPATVPANLIVNSSAATSGPLAIAFI